MTNDFEKNVSSDYIIEVFNDVSYLHGSKITSEIYQEFRRKLGYRDENYKYLIRNNVERTKIYCRKNNFSYEETMKRIALASSWDGYVSLVCYSYGHCKCFVKHKHIHFPTGLVSLAKEFFTSKSISIHIKDSRSKPIPNLLQLNTSESLQNRDYHVQIAEDAVKKTRGIIKCATGGGKTAIAALILSKLKVSPVCFYVTSKYLLNQAYSEMVKFIKNEDLPLVPGIIGNGKRDIFDINIMTVQTAIRSLGQDYDKFDEEDEDDNTDISDKKEDIKNLITNSQCIVCDEVQHWAAKTCQVISQASPNAYYRFGLSATPWRDNGDDILIDSCFGKPIADISASYLIDKKFLMKPTIYFININNMKNTQYSTYQHIYKYCLKENKHRNQIISDLATKFYNEKRKILILCSHIDHGNMLKSMIANAVFIHGSVSMKERQKQLELMRGDDPYITIATNIMDEGVDIKPLDTLILAGSGKSSTRALQRIGRIIRPWPDIDNNKKRDVIAIDFMDDCKYLINHSRKRKKIYESEKLFVIKNM